MSDFTVHKLDAAGAELLTYSASLAAKLEHGVELHARWQRATLDLGYVTFEPGDRFIEWFFDDRWYNIFEIHAAMRDGLKGWYCNVAAPARITSDAVRCRDLLLDLWVAPDGTSLVLDKEEFAATPLDPVTRRAALQGLSALKQHIARRQAPFDGLRPAPRSRGLRNA